MAAPTLLLAHKRTIVIAAMVIVALIAIWFSLRAILGVDSPFYVVSSESMQPSLEVGDVAVISNGPGFSFEDARIGDIIVFHTDDAGGRVIIHRIIELYKDSQTGERLIKTKGDNNPESYEGFDYPIREQDYFGKVVTIIPKIGMLGRLVNP